MAQRFIIIGNLCRLSTKPAAGRVQNLMAKNSLYTEAFGPEKGMYRCVVKC